MVVRRRPGRLNKTQPAGNLGEGTPRASATLQSPESVADWQQQVLACVRAFGADHETTLSARANLGHRRGLAGDPIAALVDLEIASGRCLSVPGADNATTVGTTGLRAYWLGQTGDRAAALAAYDKLWPQAVRTLGADDLTTLSILHGYNDIRDWTDSPGSAVAAYEGLLTAYTRVLGSDHERTATVAEALERWRVEVADLADTAREIYTDMELRESGRDTRRRLGTSHLGGRGTTFLRPLAHFCRRPGEPQRDPLGLCTAVRVREFGVDSVEAVGGIVEGANSGVSRAFRRGNDQLGAANPLKLDHLSGHRANRAVGRDCVDALLGVGSAAPHRARHRLRRERD